MEPETIMPPACLPEVGLDCTPLASLPVYTKRASSLLTGPQPERACVYVEGQLQDALDEGRMQRGAPNPDQGVREHPAQALAGDMDPDPATCTPQAHVPHRRSSRSRCKGMHVRMIMWQAASAAVSERACWLHTGCSC